MLATRGECMTSAAIFVERADSTSLELNGLHGSRITIR